MKEIRTNKAFNLLAGQSKPILLDFYADWCGPCQTLLPVVTDLAEQYKGKVHIQKVNVDKMPQLAQKFGVRSIPALFLIQDKKIVDKALGYQSERQLKKMLDSHLKKTVVA